MENDLIYQFKQRKYYQLDKNKNFVFNTKKSRNVKISNNCRSLGIWIGRKFIPVSKWNDNIEPINNDNFLTEYLKSIQ